MTQPTTTPQTFDPLNSQKGCWKLVNGNLAKVGTRPSDHPTKPGTDFIIKYYPKSFHLHARDHIPTGGPQQLKTYKPTPKFRRQKQKARA